MSGKFNCVIMGAAGRDFHDFQTFFFKHPEFHVCGFTATQIPFIEQRSFPKSLAGPGYDHDIPIFPEDELPELIKQFDVDFVFLAYSDLGHCDVMHKASLVQAQGASFALLGPKHTQLESRKPVISITAVRTGAGKSPITQWLARHLTERGYRAAVIRHPMPYGNLRDQAVERFVTAEDLDRFQCTIEEREEYEPYIEDGLVVFAGVDYKSIIAEAESEFDVLLWDGGNNDYSFLRPDLSIVVVDALRPGHEVGYYPGETNFRSADVLVINKVAQAKLEDLELIRDRATNLNPSAVLIESELEIEADHPEVIAGRRVLVVEDGPTLTHGGVSFGAGTLAASRYGAAEVVDPRPAAVGTIAAAFEQYPHLSKALPALGYSEEQCRELAATIGNCGAEVIVDASPARLDRMLKLALPVVRIGYQFAQTGGVPLEKIVGDFLDGKPSPGPGDTSVGRLRDAFVDEHRKLTKGIARILEALRSDEGLTTLVEMAEELDALAGPHIQFEEEVFYPEVARCSGQEYVNQLYHEHEVGRQALMSILQRKEGEELCPTDRKKLVDQFQTALNHAVSCGTLLSHLTNLSPEHQERTFEQLEKIGRLRQRWTELPKRTEVQLEAAGQ